MDLPLHEDDLEAEAILEPSRIYANNGAPRRAVMCFFADVVEAFGSSRHAMLRTVQGGRPLYETQHRGQRVAYFYPGMGAPASVACLEEAIAMGCRDIIAVGAAGALVPDLAMGDAVVVDNAVRDEGTSFHYLPPSRTVAADERATAAIAQALTDAGTPFVRGRTWTTDAIFRETRARVRRRVDEGCLTVEMEAAALFAAGRYRGARVALLLYAGDSLAGPEWEHRRWMGATGIRERFFALALDAAAGLHPTPEPT
jgi:uridine phosphorylase